MAFVPAPNRTILNDRYANQQILAERERCNNIKGRILSPLANLRFRGRRHRPGYLPGARAFRSTWIERASWIISVVASCGSGSRDRALILIGYAAALHQSEVVPLDITHIPITPGGLWIAILRSKGDQDGGGQVVPIGRTGSLTCPTAAYGALAGNGQDRRGHGVPLGRSPWPPTLQAAPTPGRNRPGPRSHRTRRARNLGGGGRDRGARHHAHHPAPLNDDTPALQPRELALEEQSRAGGWALMAS